jgi:transcription elongation factor GreA
MLLNRPVYVSRKGLAELKEELAFLMDVKRPDIIERLHEAKGGGDWKDSTESMLIEEELLFVDGRIQELEDMLSVARLIESDQDTTMINVGDTVVIQANGGPLEEFTITGIAEADPGKGLISNESPLGRALLGHRVSEQIVVKAPMGEIRYRILSHT